MVFSSISFIYIFLPLFVIIYCAVSAKYRNTVLFLGSMVFYAVGSFKSPEHILVFFLCILANFIIGKIIDSSKYKSFWLWVGILLNFTNLFYFKYSSFVSDQLTGNKLDIILPVGISFYTFQAVSYLADIKRGKCRCESSFVNFGAYLSMFPQLIAGPIVTYPDIKYALYKRECKFTQIIEGSETFIIGLVSKVLLANNIAGLWRQAENIGFDSISTPLAWMAIFAYSFQLYFDFCGYSLMAIGLGQMFGFSFPRNFDSPYISVSMTEFWRRWHITLGSWFREYVYIPLGGSRKGRAATVLNLFIVWMFTGIWHGAGYNFLIWGFVLFVILLIEKNGLKDFLEKHRFLGHCYMFFLIPLTWAIFVNTDTSNLLLFFKRLIGLGGSEYIFAEDYIKYGMKYGIVMLLCFICSTDIPKKIIAKIKGKKIYYTFLILAFWAVAYCLYKGMDDPFLYFQF